MIIHRRHCRMSIQSQPKGVCIRRSLEQWQTIVEQFVASGQTVESFCADRSLALRTFSRWRQQLCASAVMVRDQPVFVELTDPSELSVPDVLPWYVGLQLGDNIYLRLRHRC